MPPVKIKGLAKPKDTKKTLKSIFSYMKEFKFLWIFVFFCVILTAFSEIAGSYLIKPALNNYIIPLIHQKNPDFMPFFKLLCAMAFVFLLGAAASWANSRLMLHISTKLLLKIRKDLFEKLQALPVRFFDSKTHGELMSRFTSDTDTLRDMFSQTVPQLMNSSITVVGVFLMMLILSPVLTAVIALTIFGMILVGRIIGKKSADSFRMQQKAIGNLNGYIEEMIEGQKVVKIFNHEKSSKIRFAKLNDELCKAGTRANAFGNMLGPVMGNLSHIQFAFISVLGALFVIYGRLDLGTVAAFLQYTRSFSRPVSMISQLFNSILNALAGAERIFSIIEEEIETDEGRFSLVNAYEISAKDSSTGKPVLVQAYAHTGQWAWKDNADNHLVPLLGDVVFKNVTFGYKQEKTILHNINLHAKPGQKIALVGATGSGKTTIINLLTRFYDVQEDSGTILFDGIPINSISRSSLRRSLGMVLQDTHLFTGTILENIRYGNLEASRAQVETAAKMANADNFIRHLENGYDTVITADGASLSQGQRQLLSIARAAVANPPVLILDEATSSIDTRTERLIQDGMDRLMKGRTVFVIAHRLSTVKNSDEIIVLEKGHIAERGTHDSLLEQKGLYYALCNSVGVE